MVADAKGFISIDRLHPPRRKVSERIRDWGEVYEPLEDEKVVEQARRCMDCGIPFCHYGCPLGNIIPEWNEAAGLEKWARAAARLAATNNFPEFTGRLCPAPCESACVLGINRDPVTIELIEKTIAENAFAHGWYHPIPATRSTGKKVAVVGSGPSGLAAAQQLTRAGHDVAVYERSDRPGGLLRYGIPEFKMEKWVLDRRIDQMVKEGTRFITSTAIGSDLMLSELAKEYDAVVLAIGSTIPRDLKVPGRDLDGIMFAMDYLPHANRAALGEVVDNAPSAQGKHVIIIGGGDTGADCLGTATRQGAASITQLEILPEPPRERPANQPWPIHPLIFKITSAHEEAGERMYAVSTARFHGSTSVEELELTSVEMTSAGPKTIPGTERRIPAELVLLAMGFVGPELSLVDPEGVLEKTERGTIATDQAFKTSLPNVFAAGDARRGQSLIVWAIAEGRSVASAVDAYLMGETELPAPINVESRPLSLT